MYATRSGLIPVELLGTQGSETLIVGKVLRSGRWERQVAVAAFLSFLLLFSFFVEGVDGVQKCGVGSSMVDSQDARVRHE